MTTETLITKVANAAQGHDSLGPTGLVLHMTPAERDKIIAGLARTTPSDAQVTAATKALCDLAETNHLHGFCKRDWPSNGDCNCEKIASTVLTAAAQAGEEKYRDALEQIALLDEADGHELNRGHAFQAVAIATSTLGKHPSQICAERSAAPAPLGRADDDLVSRGSIIDAIRAVGVDWEAAGDFQKGHAAEYLASYVSSLAAKPEPSK